MPASAPSSLPIAAAGHAEADAEARFAELQRRFAREFPALSADDRAPRSVVIIPSLSLDQQVMAKVKGAHHYEERMLCLLLLLRMPRTRIVYVTSTHINENIIDYYLHMLPGIPAQHARRRLTLLACSDSSAAPLSQKILDRPRLIERILAAVPDPSRAHLTCFTVSGLERDLALRLGMPIYGAAPSLAVWGTKSGSRAIFREAGIAMPDGFENLADADDVARALAELKGRQPDLGKAVVKIDEGFSGEGNAIVDLAAAPGGRALLPWMRERLPDMAFAAGDMDWGLYEAKLRSMGGIVEAFVPGAGKRSPSAQFRIDPAGQLDIVSTHDQVLGGNDEQIFLGCRFPADEAYRLAIQDAGLAAAKVLAGKGVIGRFGIDFVSVPEGCGWRHYAIEINLRKGGTTHPYLMLQFLTGGGYDAATGRYVTAGGSPRSYFATDNLESERYRGLTPTDLIDIAAMNRLHFNAATGEGVAFHLIGALSQFGKLGVVCIGETLERAEALYRRTVEVLDAEAR